MLYFLLFYLFNDVEQIRHGISIGFCFYSLKFLLNDDLKSQLLSILCIVLGILFHTSAVLFLFVYVLKDKFLDKKVYIILFILSIVLSFVNYFDVIAAINDSLIHSAYLSTKLNSYQHQSQSRVSLTIAIKIAMLSIFYLFAFDVKNKMHRLLFNIYYLGIVCTCAFSSIPILIARGSLYMRYTELLIIPIYISSIKDKSNKKIHYCILALIFIYYFMKFFISVLDPIYFNYSSI